MTILEWANRWGVSLAALNELCALSVSASHSGDGWNEAGVQAEIRLAAAKRGILLWRNNRGAGEINGSHIRWGLANDSKKLGDAIKSADLIGIEPVEVTSAMVGSTIGRFLSVEVKSSKWRWTGTADETAQAAWAAIVNQRGGRAIITNSTEGL